MVHNAIGRMEKSMGEKKGRKVRRSISIFECTKKDRMLAGGKQKSLFDHTYKGGNRLEKILALGTILFLLIFRSNLQHGVHDRAALLLAAGPVVGRVLQPRALEELPHRLLVVVDVLGERAEGGVGAGGAGHRRHEHDQEEGECQLLQLERLPQPRPRPQTPQEEGHYYRRGRRRLRVSGRRPTD